jgi:NAD(P)-dependent dehydrogenase (short-subunit alcohol dehydrogenase family)
MQVQDKVVVVTGGGRGIGRALCERFAADGARAVVVADLDLEPAQEVASALSCRSLAVEMDVSDEAQVAKMVEDATAAFGRVDLFCANAGIAEMGGADASDASWRRSLDVNVMSLVYATRAVLPQMLARGDGTILITASAAGLLSQIGSAPYSVSKHAAVGFAEWLAIAHGDAGIQVACLCPQGVMTDMLKAEGTEFLRRDAVTPEAVAESVVECLSAGRFLVLPHPEVRDYQRAKVEDPDRWLGNMRKLSQKILGG